MDFFSDLSGSFAFALGLIFLGTAILLLAVAALVNRARDRATYTDLATGGTLPPTVPSSEESLDIVDFRTTASEPQLRVSFARALRLLRDYLPGRGARYRLPWLLSLGQTAAGKTTLLAHTELKMPFGEPEEPRQEAGAEDDPDRGRHTHQLGPGLDAEDESRCDHDQVDDHREA